MHIYFHSLLWSYLPRVSTILTTCVNVLNRMYDTSHASTAYFFLIDKGSCYGVGSGTIAGIIFADVAMTVLIVTTTYWYASKRRQKKENGEKLHRPTQMFSILKSVHRRHLTCMCPCVSLADEVYMNVRANCKTWRSLEDWHEQWKTYWHLIP